MHHNRYDIVLQEIVLELLRITSFTFVDLVSCKLKISAAAYPLPTDITAAITTLLDEQEDAEPLLHLLTKSKQLHVHTHSAVACNFSTVGGVEYYVRTLLPAADCSDIRKSL
jgi:hypothetical protein